MTNNSLQIEKPRRRFAGPVRLAEALDHMATPALVLEPGGMVAMANRSAMGLLRLPGRGGYRLASVLAGWKGVELLVAADGRRSQAVRLVHGSRVLDCAVRPVAGSGVVVTLHEAGAPSAVVHGHGREDPLTGLLDRGGFRAALATVSGTGGALLHIGLDRFKTVNDTLGHTTGDALLLKIADRLRRATRSCDTVARLGGDEFGVLQGGAGSAEATELLAERLIDLLGRTYVVDGHVLDISASVGVVRLGPDGAEPDTLLRNADLALRQAKADGRGVHRSFLPVMDQRLQTRRLLELDLRRALAFKEFRLAYQPQFRATDGRIVGFEALLRWHSPSRGLVSPAEFIPLAEEIGLMPAIDEWVLHAACREAAGWPLPVSVAVNVSPVQFRSPKLTDMVLNALGRSGLAPQRLELEITEGALLENTAPVVAILGRLAELGIQTSMDDFGTGYSSLSYLQKFRFNKIKIDQSFVRQLGISADSTAIVRAVAVLGTSLGIKTTAEGVETPEQLAQIKAEGCTEVQGYLTGRPMPGPAASRLLASAACPGWAAGCGA